MPSLTYRYRLYPHGDQAGTLECWIELCRRLYNVALEQRRDAWKRGRKVGYLEQQRDLTEVRAAFPEYVKAPVHVLQNALLRLDRAYENFFRRVREKARRKGFPRFRARDRYRSVTCPDRYNYVRDGKLHFPKIDRPIRMAMHRPFPEGAVIKSCTISKKADGWYVSFSLEVPASAKLDHAGEAVGLDSGLISFAALSTGETVKAPKFLRRSEQKLKRAQRVLSRRRKGSKRRGKQREKVARLYARIAHQRDDWQWKLATDLARRFSLIAVENLNVRGMLRNRLLAKSISDASWSAFLRTKLAHAVVKTGAGLVFVNVRNTSKTCSRCGWVADSMPLSERTFRCGKCGLALDRDVNAAVNIEKLGRDTPEVTLAETRASAFRYRKASPVEEARTVLEDAHA